MVLDPDNSAVVAKIKKVQPQFSRELYNVLYKRSVVLAERDYPDVKDASSPLSQKAFQIRDRLISERNPIVYLSDSPHMITKMAADELGIEPVRRTER
jgi:hypothetical protein